MIRNYVCPTRVAFIRCLGLLSLSLALLAATLGAPQAWAIAPAQQQTNPTLGTSLYDVVNLVTDPTLSVGAVDAGTGSIIDSEVVDGIGYFCVLTAQHVVADANINRIGFGSWGDGTNGANSYIPTYPITSHYDGGATGGEDISVAVVRYGTPDAFFDTVSENALSLWSPPAGNQAQTAAYVMANVASFTEIGYGLTATPHYTAGVQDGWTPTLPPPAGLGIQRFQNNFPTSTADKGVAGAQISWHPHNPSAPNTGEGSSFGGDSGGPYLLESTTTRTISGLPDPQHQGMTLPDQTIQLYTDTIFAVHTFGNNNNPALYTDTTAGGAQIDNGGVILTPADITWINSVPCPEPSGFVLAALGLLGMVGSYLRHRRTIVYHST